MQNGDTNSEESWVKLPDGSILSYSILASNRSGVSQAQRYIPSIHQWEPAGVLPVPLSSDTTTSEVEKNELGPAFLLPDRRVLYLGANGNTALYNTSTVTWTAGPKVPDNLAAGDSPGAMLPNGHVIFSAHPLTSYTPTKLFDFSPATNRITPVRTPAALTQILMSTYTYVLRMLVLPTGQLLLADGTSQAWIFTPNGSPKPSWRPMIRSVKEDGNGTFTLTGTQLNGISEGAAYGDDAQMLTNYPIVALKNCKNGTVTYARTFNWSSTGVDTGSLLETTDFSLPPAMASGSYRLSVSASGISSRSVRFRV